MDNFTCRQILRYAQKLAIVGVTLLFSNFLLFLRTHRVRAEESKAAILVQALLMVMVITIVLVLLRVTLILLLLQLLLTF